MSDEFPIKFPNGLHDEISRLGESCKDGIQFDRPELIKRYHRGELCIWVKFRTLGTPDACDLYALFRKASGREYAEVMRDGMPSVVGVDAHRIHESTCGHNQQEAMLVFNVVAVEGIEDRRGCPIPSIVRLFAFDEPLSRKGNGLYLSAIHGRFEFLGRFRNGETVIRTDGFTLMENHRDNQVIKAGSEMVNDLARDDGEAQRQSTILKAYPSIGTSFVLRLSDNSVGLGIGKEEGINLGLEVLDVLFGPFNLCPASLPEV